MKIKNKIIIILLSVCLKSILIASNIEDYSLDQNNLQQQNISLQIDNSGLNNESKFVWQQIPPRYYTGRISLIDIPTITRRNRMTSEEVFLNMLECASTGKITYEDMIENKIFHSVLTGIDMHDNVKNQIKIWMGNNKNYLLGAKCSKEMIAFLIELGLDINAQDINGNTLLHLAAICNDTLDLIVFLLNNGLRINCKNRGGNAPLHIASAVNNAKNVRLLLDNDADITIKNVSNLTAEDLAASESVRNLLIQARMAKEQELDAAIWF